MAEWRAANPTPITSPPLDRTGITADQIQFAYQVHRELAAAQQFLRVPESRVLTTPRTKTIMSAWTPKPAPRRAPWPAVLPGAPLAVRVTVIPLIFVITLGVAMIALCWLGWRAFAARMNAAAARLP
jgi:hypothetical protein